MRDAAARGLGEIGGRAGVAALFEALRDASEAVRASAAQALVRVGPAAGDVPALAGALDNPDGYVAAFAAWSLGNLGAAAEPAVPDLVRLLARDDTNAVVAAALARVGPAAKAAVPELVKALASDDDGRRWRAARTLGRIGPAAEPAVAALTGALSDPNSVVRAHAARALGRIGPGAMPAAAALQRATGDRESGVRDEARLALARLRGRRTRIGEQARMSEARSVQERYAPQKPLLRLRPGQREGPAHPQLRGRRRARGGVDAASRTTRPARAC